MKVISAKFNSTCADTGRPIRKGDVCVYDPIAKKVYASGSPTQAKHYNDTKPDTPDLDDMLEQQAEQWYNQTYNQ